MKNVSTLENRFNLTNNGIVIFNPIANDAGKYKCTIPNSDPIETADIEVVANVYVEKMPEKTSAVRTTKLEIHCKAHGTAPKIHWTIDGKEITDKKNIKLMKDSNNIENAILVIESVERTDQNKYNCTATNKATGFQIDEHRKYEVAKNGTFVKVRGTVWGRVVSVWNWFY